MEFFEMVKQRPWLAETVGRQMFGRSMSQLLLVIAVQLVGTQRNPANLYLALVSHEYSGRNHSVLHELLHYYRDFPITNYAKFGFRITTKQPATTSMGSVIDIGKCLACETSLLLFKLQYRTRIKG